MDVRESQVVMHGGRLPRPGSEMVSGATCSAACEHRHKAVYSSHWEKVKGHGASRKRPRDHLWVLHILKLEFFSLVM